MDNDLATKIWFVGRTGSPIRIVPADPWRLACSTESLGADLRGKHLLSFWNRIAARLLMAALPMMALFGAVWFVWSRRWA